jgi:hypothetical protein
MVVTPVLANLSISSIFVSSAIVFFSFWSPSRGPTSTILTRLSKVCCAADGSVAVAKVRTLRGGILLGKYRAIGRKDFILGRDGFFKPHLRKLRLQVKGDDVKQRRVEALAYGLRRLICLATPARLHTSSCAEASHPIDHHRVMEVMSVCLTGKNTQSFYIFQNHFIHLVSCDQINCDLLYDSQGLL